MVYTAGMAKAKLTSVKSPPINTLYLGLMEKTLTTPEAKGSQEGADSREAGSQENLRRIVGNDIDTAELLHEHDNPRSKSSSAITGNREQFQITVATPHDARFGLEQDMDICENRHVRI